MFLENTAFYHHLYNKIGIKIEDNNMDVQEEYFHILDKVIDACVLLRYENNRNYYVDYTSLDQINSLILKKFRESVPEKEMLEYLSQVFAGMVDREEELSYFYDRLKKLYQVYITEKELDYKVTTDFYNEILNKQRDAFLSKLKETIKEGLKSELPYTEKMRNKLDTNFKIQKCLSLLKSGDYSSLGTTEDEMKRRLDTLHLYLNTIKPFNKNNHQLSSSVLEQFDLLFLNGELIDENLKSEYPFLEAKERKVILNQYHKLLLPYLDSIEVEYEGNSLDVEFNYNHYQIVSEERYQERLKKIINLLSREEMNYVSDNIDRLSFLFKLLPLVGIIDEFNDENFRNIIVNYDKICTKLTQDKNLESLSFDYILNHLFELITLGRVYYHSDRYTEAIFGQEILGKIVNNFGFSSSDPKDYLDVYHSMLECSSTYIPPLFGEFGDYVYESGNNYDVDKLLMGIYCSDSCLGIDDAGEDAYLEALTSERADVVFVRRKDNSEFVARFLMFRKGNFVIMAPIQGRNFLCHELYQEEFLSMIGKQILDLAQDANDSLDYVFAQKTSLLVEAMPDITLVNSECFEDGMPHCDIDDNAGLIATRSEKVELQPTAFVVTYPKKRKDITVKGNNCNSELARIKALELSSEDNSFQKEKLECEFDMILNTNYQQAYIGQDWYIAIKSDGGIEKAMLNTHDSRQNEEILTILDQVVDLSLDSSVDVLDLSFKSSSK